MNEKQKQANKRMRKQRMFRRAAGLGLLLACALIVFMASKGNNTAEKEATPIVFLVPMALALIFAK